MAVNTVQQSIGRVEQNRARRRLAKVRLADPKSLPGVSPTAHGNFTQKQRAAILQASGALKSRSKPSPDDPLQPLSGASLRREVGANTKLKYGGAESGLRDAVTAQDKTTGLVSSAYDQYHAALQQALAHIEDVNKTSADTSQGHVDTAYQEDLANAKTDEGKQTAAGIRGQGNADVTGMRTQGNADTGMYSQRTANSLLGKTEALQRQQDKRDALTQKQRDLKDQEGAFKVSERGKLRESERQYSAVRKEFGLKVKTEKDANAAKTGTNATQKLVAKLYADANQAKAAATIRVAKLQLKKGKIDQHQYTQITNIYKGLPKKGTAPQAKKPAAGNPAGGSGAGGSLAPWETDDITGAEYNYSHRKYGLSDKKAAINAAIRNGVPERLARQAWANYAKRLRNNRTTTGPDGSGGTRPT